MSRSVAFSRDAVRRANALTKTPRMTSAAAVYLSPLRNDFPHRRSSSLKVRAVMTAP